MIGLEIINLFPKQYRPQILAYEFYYVQIVREAWSVARESVSVPSLAYSLPITYTARDGREYIYICMYIHTAPQDPAQLYTPTSQDGRRSLLGVRRLLFW